MIRFLCRNPIRVYVSPSPGQMFGCALLFQVKRHTTKTDIIRKRLRVKWRNPGYGVAPPPLHLDVVAVEKGAVGSPLTIVDYFIRKKMRGDPIEAFKIINGICNYGRHFYNISPWTGNLLSRQISKRKSTNQLEFWQIVSYIFLEESETSYNKNRYYKTLLFTNLNWFGNPKLKIKLQLKF